MERQPTFETPSGRSWVLRSDADVYEQRVEYAPGSPYPPEHFHPGQDEHFEVEQGALLFVVDGKERVVATGETLEVASGTPHKVRNASASDPAVVRWETRPGLRSARFYAIAAALGGEAGLLQLALFADEFGDVFQATGLRGRLIPPLAALARRRGLKLPALESD